MTRELVQPVQMGTPDSLRPGAMLYTRKYGWVEVAAVEALEWDEMNGVMGATNVTLAEPQGDVTVLVFPPYTTVLMTYRYRWLPDSMLEEWHADPMVDLETPYVPPEEPEEPPAGPAGHYVYRDAGTGEFVDEAYAQANPDTTVSEWVLDE
jgi:hypothetical protein